jgi:predicted O-methyltransferase YrrM
MGMILFLDDMETRHTEFDRYARGQGHVIIHVHTADEAIRSLSGGQFDQVFLDHDLSHEDIMVKVGEQSVVPTGMTVVDHILTMENPPLDVIVHSCNGPAREEMVRRLETLYPAIRVRGIPFPELVRRFRTALR